MFVKEHVVIVLALIPVFVKMKMKQQCNFFFGEHEKIKINPNVKKSVSDFGLK